MAFVENINFFLRPLKPITSMSYHISSQNSKKITEMEMLFDIIRGL